MYLSPLSSSYQQTSRSLPTCCMKFLIPWASYYQGHTQKMQNGGDPLLQDMVLMKKKVGSRFKKRLVELPRFKKRLQADVDLLKLPR